MTTASIGDSILKNMFLEVRNKAFKGGKYHGNYNNEYELEGDA